jgi:hypothetical protein
VRCRSRDCPFASGAGFWEGLEHDSPGVHRVPYISAWFGGNDRHLLSVTHLELLLDPDRALYRETADVPSCLVSFLRDHHMVRKRDKLWQFIGLTCSLIVRRSRFRIAFCCHQR